MVETNGVDLDQIAHQAASEAHAAYPSADEPSLRVKLGVLLATLLVLINTVVGVYNSIALHSQVQCNRQLQLSLAVVGDQNRNITKDAIDTALSGKIRTLAQAKAIRDKYDTAFDDNSKRRSEVLASNCQ